MKFRFGILAKFGLLATIIVIILVFALTFTNLRDQELYSEKKLDEQLNFYMQNIYDNFGDIESLKNYNYTNASINKFMNKNKNILSFNIITLGQTAGSIETKLIIYASSDYKKVGSEPDYYSDNDDVYKKGKIIKEELTSDYHQLCIFPIVGDENNFIGTYEFTIYLQEEELIQQQRINNIITVSLFFLVGIVIGLILLLRYIVQKPLIILKNAAVALGKGNLDTHVDIKFRDELGELASSFNEMAKDLKESREKIEEYNRILEKLLDQKDEFIGQLGHDLKNPLQPFIGLLPLLIEKETDPEKKEALKVMSQNAEYMKNLIFNTLELAKLRSDNIKFNFEKINLKDITKEIVNSQSFSLKEKNISIENKINKNIFVKADKLRLSEVFINIINNSIKYIKDHNGEIELNAEKIKNKFIKIGIRDTGIGLNDEQTKRIFDEYYKVDEQTSDYYSTGLGLQICKRIVEKHGGKIWVESPGIGKGSIFYFTIKEVNN